MWGGLFLGFFYAIAGKMPVMMFVLAKFLVPTLLGQQVV